MMGKSVRKPSSKYHRQEGTYEKEHKIMKPMPCRFNKKNMSARPRGILARRRIIVSIQDLRKSNAVSMGL